MAQQRGKFTSKVHALFPKIFAQNLEYLAALWSNLDEKLSSWSSRTTGAKVGKINKTFRKVPSGKRHLNFFGFGVVINIVRHSIAYIFLGGFVYWQIRFG